MLQRAYWALQIASCMSNQPHNTCVKSSTQGKRHSFQSNGCVYIFISLKYIQPQACRLTSSYSLAALQAMVCSWPFGLLLSVRVLLRRCVAQNAPSTIKVGNTQNELLTSPYLTSIWKLSRRNYSVKAKWVLVQEFKRKNSVGPDLRVRRLLSI